MFRALSVFLLKIFQTMTGIVMVNVYSIVAAARKCFKKYEAKL